MIEISVIKELKKIFRNIRLLTIIKFQDPLKIWDPLKNLELPKKYGANNISRVQNTQEDFPQSDAAMSVEKDYNVW